MRITSRFIVAMLISVFVNLLFLLQPLASAILIFGKATQYTYPNAPYVLDGIFLWPLFAGIAYYALTMDKRITFPLQVQFWTLMVATFIIIADSLQSGNALLVLYSYLTYLQEFGLILGGFAFLTLVFGVIQMLGLRVLLGMEVREQPDLVNVSVDVPMSSLASLMDEQFLTSHALRVKKSSTNSVSLYSTRRNTGEEIVLALQDKDAKTSIISLSALDEYLFHVMKSDYARTIMDGLYRSIRERILASYPKAVFAQGDSDSLASREVLAYSLRKSKTASARASSLYGRARRRLRISIGGLHIPKAYLGFGFVIVAMMLVVGYLHPPNLVEIYVILILGLLLDFGLPLYQDRQERKT